MAAVPRSGPARNDTGLVFLPARSYARGMLSRSQLPGQPIGFIEPCLPTLARAVPEKSGRTSSGCGPSTKWAGALPSGLANQYAEQWVLARVGIIRETR